MIDLPVSAGLSAILMLHRVGDRDPTRIPANQNMVVTPGEIDDFILDAKNKGWSFVSLDAVSESIKKRRQLKKSLVFTFDDGYLDNLLEAAPILVSHEVPFVVYVSTGYIGTRSIPWWYKLEEILAAHRKVRLPDGSEFAIENLEKKQSLFLLIRKEIMRSATEAKPYKDWIEMNLADPVIEQRRLFMNWDEVEALASLPNVTIGAHTHSHAVLSRLADDDAYEEIRRSKEILERRINREVRHFAYPFGGIAEASEREFRQAEALGFETAVTTQFGAVDTAQPNRYSLPRCFYEPGLTMDGLQNKLVKNVLKSRLKKLLIRV